MSQPLRQDAAVTQPRFRCCKLADRTPRFVGGHFRGTVTLVGHKVWYATREDRLSVFSLKTYTWKAISKTFMGANRGHQAELGFDKVYYLTAKGGVVEYDPVLNEARLLMSETNGASRSGGGLSWMSAVFAPWRSEIISFGGYDRYVRRTNSVQAFNVESKTWKEIEMRGKPPEPRTSPAAVMCGTKMYVFGGFNLEGHPIGDLWIAELSSFVAPTWTLAKTCGNDLFKTRTPSIKYFSNCLVVFGEAARFAENLQIFSRKEGGWHNQDGSQIVVNWDAAITPHEPLALTLHTGILYFTGSGIFLLSAE